MAKNQRQFDGWTCEMEADKPSASVRRSRRSQGPNDDQIALKRSDDGLELRAGDCVLVDQKDSSPEICLIKDIRFGIDDYIEISVMWFMRKASVESQYLPKDAEFSDNDLFITPVQDRLYVTEVLERANVLADGQFQSITVDDSNRDTTFVCRRACDESGQVFSSPIQWEDFQAMVKQSSVQFLHEVKSITTVAKPQSKASSPKKVQLEKKKISYAEPDSDDFSASESENDSDSEVASVSSESDVGLDDSDVEFESGDKRRKSAPGTTVLKKRNRKPNSNRGKTVARARRRSDSLPSLPKSTLNFGDGLDDEMSDMSATPIFKQARKRLHANAKLQSLPCREDEFFQIYQNLEDAVESSVGTCIYVSGTPGTGKTATIREVVKQLANSYVDKGQEDAFDYVEINGLKLLSPQAAYEVLWEKISSKRVAAANAAVLLDSHFEKNDSKRAPLVVLMDELDQIVTKTQTVIYNFFNWPTYKNSKLIVIAVANTMDLPERMLTNKISSRLGLKRIQFPGYDYKQLAEIIRHRLQDLEKLNSGKLVIKKDAIDFAARKVASVSGDARRALIICRRAIEISEWEYFKRHGDSADKTDETFTVQIMHIMKAVNETTSSPVTVFLQSLSFVSKLFLVCLLSRKRKTGLAENSVDTIIDEMDNAVTMQTSSALNRVLLREKIELNKMLYGITRQNLRIEGYKYIVEELLESGIILQTRGESERLALVKLNIGDDEIINVFKKDENIQGIGGF